MNMYKVFRDTDYLVLKNNYEASKAESDKLFWKLLMDLKSKNYNKSDMNYNNKNKVSNELRWLYLNTKYMRMQDNLYGSETPEEQEFWQKMIEHRHKEIEIIMKSEKKDSNSVTKENLYARLKSMSPKEKEALCTNSLSKLSNNIGIEKLINTIVEKDSKISKEQASKITIDLLTKELMKEPDFEDKLVDIINEERKRRVYVTTKEDLEKYHNVNKAIKEDRFKFLQTNVSEGITNKGIDDTKSEGNVQLKNSLIKNLSKLFARLKK